MNQYLFCSCFEFKIGLQDDIKYEQKCAVFVVFLSENIGRDFIGELI